MATFAQRSFSGGELSPALYSRVDTTKYGAGLRTCRNMLVMRHGGAQNRPGMRYVGEVKDSDETTHRLIPFVFNADQTYVLEFGERYIRLFKDGEPLEVSGVSAWADATAYVTGDVKSYSGVNYYCTNDHTSATANDRPSTGTNWEDYWYEMTGDILEIPTPYTGTDLPALKFTQSADVMTFVHPTYSVFELSRLGAQNWVFSGRGSISSVTSPANPANNGASTHAVKAVSSISAAAPKVFTSVGHGYTSGDFVWLYSRYQINSEYQDLESGRWVRLPTEYVRYDGNGSVTVLSADTFTITFSGASAAWGAVGAEDPVINEFATFQESSVVKTGTSAALLYKTQYVVTAENDDGIESQPSLVTGTSDVPSSSTVITLTWTAVSGIKKYNVYKKTGALFGFVGTADRPIFTDNGIEPDVSITAPFADDGLFRDEDGYPSAVGYYQQRLLFASTNEKPETVWGSRTGDFGNFSKRDPLQDDDMVEFTMAGRQVNAVKHMLDLGKLIVFTSGGEFAVQGDAAGVLTPSDVNVRQYSYHGSSDLAPIAIGNGALFVQARGSIVRDIGFDYQVDGYRGGDLTVFSAHMFEGYTLLDWAYAQIPQSIVWAVRSDGALLGLTYLKEHDVLAWHRHDTDGTFENACVVPEGTEDVLYAIVSRDGGRYIERMATRQVNDIEDSIFLDSSMTFDGTNTGATTMTLSGGTTWERGETLTLTASAGTFTDGLGESQTTFVSTDDDNSNMVFITYDGVEYRCEIQAYTSATVVSVTVNRDIPVALRSSAQTAWAKAKTNYTGLTHLASQIVSVLGDGFVVASPNNENLTELTVTAGGALTLPVARAVVQVGLPYLSDLETLDIDTVQGETMVDKRKLITKVTCNVENSRGMWAGSSDPGDDDPLDGLHELKQRTVAAGYDSTTPLYTEPVEIPIKSEWNSNGRVFIRQVDPLPLTILSVNPSGLIPRGGG